MRRLLMIAALISVSLIGLIAQTQACGPAVSTLASASVYAADTGTTRIMTNQTTTSTTSQATTSLSTGASANSSLAQSPDDFTIKVDPTYRSIDLGNGKIPTAGFSVQIEALSGFQGKVELSVKGLPESAKAVFNPEEGAPTPLFVSILMLSLSQSTPAGAYTMSIIGASNNVSHNATTALVVEGSSSTTTATVQQQQRRLTVSVSTERESYQKGDSVGISGYVKLNSGESVVNATVTVHVTDPLGNETHVSLASTDPNGRYWDNFTLPSSTADGTYTVYAVADVVTYRESFGQVTFVVGTSDVPSVRIVNATITMLNRTVSSEFRRGETVAVWVVIDDRGGDLVDGNTWVEVLDPNNSPVSVAVVVVTIHSGEEVRIGIQVILKPDAAVGLYTVRIIVSNAPILGGGRFLDSRETAFVVEG